MNLRFENYDMNIDDSRPTSPDLFSDDENDPFIMTAAPQPTLSFIVDDTPSNSYVGSACMSNPQISPIIIPETPDDSLETQSLFSNTSNKSTSSFLVVDNPNYNNIESPRLSCSQSSPILFKRTRKAIPLADSPELDQIDQLSQQASQISIKSPNILDHSVSPGSTQIFSSSNFVSDESEHSVRVEDQENEESETEEDLVAENIPRKRRRYADPSEWVQNKRRRLRNSGQQYRKTTKKIEPAKKIGPVCSRCRLKCTEKISDELRNIQFKEFWALADYTKQSNLLTSLVKEVLKARHRTKGASRRS